MQVYIDKEIHFSIQPGTRYNCRKNLLVIQFSEKKDFSNFMQNLLFIVKPKTTSNCAVQIKQGETTFL